MPRYAQIIMGPAGCGKSTYCYHMQQHLELAGRTAHVINLDPAAENFEYPVAWDIRDVISVEDVSETLHLGPNGGLIYCMEFLLQNLEVLDEALNYDDDYILIDCPGQIELYTHLPLMRQLMDHLQSLDYKLVAVYLLDCQFIDDTAKFFAGVLSAMSAMLQLEVPHLNLLSKMDLLGEDRRRDLDDFLSADADMLLATANMYTTERQQRLNSAMANLIDDFSLVRFLPLDNTDEGNLEAILINTDHCLQYGEEEEPREPADLDNDRNDDDSSFPM
ncbi:uncharacterized protein MONBRDRAFT_18837 [Monosiga brevicollis MX1]|uniref:GPN-loop GTPase 3 n=1 Tax=Monosiga brevicollis TaxID=81824 RepID=A9UXY7_MONBE|nr:uncharacterized protein MONBRDRAFT_18837 [Monosiga brevicollis MX1]EDQ89927.1 predicted protein [Monosiga brevicollis MX1]|eukprot:XP_001745349.1 hypothetical protein [Monosiga brevicollis MX1]